MANALIRCYDWVGNKLTSIKHPILTLIIIGMILRIVLSINTFTYDMSSWALVVRNIKIDQGLYGIEGYYYTPIWGYCLGLLAAFQDFCLNIGESAIKMIEFSFLDASHPMPLYVTSVIPTLAFTFSVKIPLMLLDIVFAYLVYVLVKDYGADDKKALLAFALAFICPTIIHTSSMDSMPDTLGAIFTILTIIFLKRNQTLLAGAMFSLAILTKFFPIFLLLPLFAYLIAKNRDDKTEMAKHIGFAACGFIVASVVIFLPQIMAGDLMSCFRFFFDRLPFVTIDGGTGMAMDMVANGIESIDMNKIVNWTRVLVYLVAGLASIYFAYRILKNREEDHDDLMIRICFVIAILCMLFPPNHQYVCFLIPFLVFWIVMRDERFITAWTIIGIGGLILVLTFNPYQLAPFAASGIIDVNMLVDWFNSWYNNGSWFSVVVIQIVLGTAITYIGILVTLWLTFGQDVKDYLGMGKTESKDIE